MGHTRKDEFLPPVVSGATPETARETRALPHFFGVLVGEIGHVEFN